jgi:mRNA-degrading endonuclease RelE of RelBE toxin-antitoxin system
MKISDNDIVGPRILTVDNGIVHKLLKISESNCFRLKKGASRLHCSISNLLTEIMGSMDDKLSIFYW